MEFYGSIDLVSGSVTASVFTGSFKGNADGLYNIQASGVTGLNLSQIANGSNTASVSTDGFNIDTDTSITGSLKVSGIITAEQYNVTVVSSSVLYQSGSTKFGDSLDDLHQLTGSINITGSISLNGEAIGTGKLNETTFNSYATSSDSRFGNIETSTGSLNSFTSSIDTTIKSKLNTENVVSGSVQINITGTTGYSTFSSSINTTVTNLSSSVATTDLSQNNRLDIIESRYATTGSNTFKGTQNVSGSIIPTIDNAFDLGSATYQWRDVYISSGSLYIDGTKVLSSTNQELTFTTDTGQSIKILEGTTDSITLQTADGNIELKSSAAGDILLDPTNGKITLKGPVEILSGQKIQSSIGGTPVVFANDIVVSGSIDLTGTIEGIDLTAFSSSLNTRIGNTESSVTSLNSFTSSASSRLGSLETESGSVRTTLNSHTSSANGRLSSIETTTGSIISTNTTQDGRLTSIESKTGSYATTGSNIFLGNQTITGSLYVSQNLVVAGSSSIEYVTSSQLRVDDNIITLNTSSPGQRFGGIEVYDSGSVNQATGSILWDSVNNRWIYQQSSESTYGGGVLLSGPRSSGSLGTELTLTSGKIAKSAGGDHLNDSIITESGGGIGIAGNLVITGSIVASGTSLVSGSSQISFTSITDKPTLVSGSSQISFNTISDKPSLISGSSQITFSGISGLPTLVSGSSQISYPSLSNIPSGLVSGSSQIDLTATTNYASGILTRLNAVGVFSGSAQVSFGSITGVPSGLVSGSAQISFGSITGVPSGLVSGSSQITGIGNSQLTNSSFFVGTTSISLGRASASQTLNGVSIDGNAATVTDGVYISGDQTISGTKTFSGTIAMGSATRQMIHLWGTQYGIGVQSSTTYFRSDSRFSWHRGGSHSDSQNNPGTGGTVAMTLDGSSNLSVTGTIGASNFSGTHSGTSSGTNTGDQTNVSGYAQYLTTSAYTSGYLVIGGGYSSNAYNAVAGGTRLMFGGGDTDAQGNYYIGTNMEDVGGNYNKLDIRWHTGIRMGAQQGYGGIRFYNNEDLGSVLFSIGYTDANVRSHTNLIPSANNSYNLGTTDLRWANIYTNDLHLSNENKEGGNEIDGTTGNWTIQEGQENLYIINNKNGKKFKINLTEII